MTVTRSYESEIPAYELVRILSDPVRVGGMSGHLNLWKKYDAKRKEFVTFDKANIRADKYLVAFVFPKGSRMVGRKLVMEGPKFEGLTIKYDLKRKDESGYLKFTVREEEKVKVEIESSLPNILGDMGNHICETEAHIINSHVIPYLSELEKRNYYFAPVSSFKTKGKVGELISRVMTMGGKRVIKAETEGKTLVVFVDEGKMGYCLVRDGNRVLMGQEVWNAIDTEKFAEATVYYLSIEDIVMSVV